MNDDVKAALTVGAVRKLIEGLPDEATFFPHWVNGPPGDSDPAVQVFGFRRMRTFGVLGEGSEGVAILVDIIYLDDIEDECALCGGDLSPGGLCYDLECPNHYDLTDADRQAAYKATGYGPEDLTDLRIEDSLEARAVFNRFDLKAMLAEKEGISEAGGGRGVELADEIDTLRVAIAIFEAREASHADTMSYVEDGVRYLACRNCKLIWRPGDHPAACKPIAGD